MNQVDAGNPYQPPAASIAALPAEVRRPPVYTAISLFCWIIGGLGVFLSAGSVIMLVQLSLKLGWRRVAFSGDGPRNILLIALGILGTITYITAGRSLWERRGTPGLILCSLAVGLTYFGFWLLTWK